VDDAMKNQLFYGDNLDVLRRYITDESVDLVYLDPPFNSQQNYNVLFKERSGEAHHGPWTAPHMRDADAVGWRAGPRGAAAARPQKRRDDTQRLFARPAEYG
jgi:DNA modification methylase